MQTVCRTGSS